MTQLTGLLTDLRWTEAAAGLKPMVKADYCGVMDGIELWTILEPIPGHPVGSTVSRQTLERAGFAIPNRRVDRDAI